MTKDAFNGKGIYLVYFIAISVCYSAVLFNNYAFSDDYDTLYKILTHTPGSLSFDIMTGRPLYAIFRYSVVTTLKDMHGFIYLRLFSVLMTFIYCCFLHDFIIKRGIFDSLWLNRLLPFCLSVVPALVVYNSWASCFNYTFSLLLSGIAYVFFSTKNIRRTWLRMVLACLILITAFAIYQPTGMAFLLFLFLDCCVKKNGYHLLKLVYAAIILCVGMIASYLMATFIPQLLYHQVFTRTSLVQNIPAKLSWIWHEPLKNAVNNYNINPVSWYTVLSVILILIGWRYIIRDGENRWMRALLVPLVALASYLPNMLIAESWAAYRSLVAIESIFCILFLLGIWSLLSLVEESKQKNLALVMVTGLMVLTQSNIYKGFIAPQQAEYWALTNALAENPGREYQGRLMFDISAPIYDAFSARHRYDEFGNTSLATPWAPRGIAESIRQAGGFHFTLGEESIVTPEHSCLADCIAIKTRDILKNAVLSPGVH